MSWRLAIAALLAAAALAPTVQADWPSFRGDAQNTGSAAGSYAVYTDVWWTVKLAGNARVQATPVLKDGILVVADLGKTQQTTTKSGSVTSTPIAAPLGVVHGIDATSGKELWATTMTAPIYGTPAIAGQLVYVADGKGVLRALDLTTGEKRYETTSIGATHGSIAFNEGKVFIGNEVGEMRAFTSELTPLWTFKTSDVSLNSTVDAKTGKCSTSAPKLAAKEIRDAPAVFDEKVFFGSYDHVLFAIDEQGDGAGKTTAQWVYPTNDFVHSSPAIAILSDDTARLVVGSYDGNVYGFDPSPSGQGANPCNGVVNAPLWSYEVPTSGSQKSKVHSSPATMGGKVYVGANNGHVYAIDAEDGSKLWEATCGSATTPVTASPVIANGKLVVGSEDKKVYWLKASDGSVLKTAGMPEAIQASVALDAGKAFLASEDGTVSLFGPEKPKQPDLTVASIKTTATTIDVTVKNLGDAAAPAETTVQVELDGKVLSTPKIGKVLEANASVVVSVPVPASENGNLPVKATVDPGNAVSESDETNNEKSQTVPVGTIGAPSPTATGNKTGGKKGFHIPGPSPMLVAAGMSLAVLVRRRRDLA